MTLRIIALQTLLCFAISLYAQFADINTIEFPIGYYASKGDKKTVYALTTPDTSEVKAIAIAPTLFLNSRMNLHIKRLVLPYNDDNIKKLKQINDKFAEWSQIAIKEKVPMMLKTIEIEIPQLYALAYKTSIDKPCYDKYHIQLENKKFKFVVPAKVNMMPYIELNIRGKDISKNSSDVVGTHTFFDVSEIQEIINLIATNELLTKIKASVELFK